MKVALALFGQPRFVDNQQIIDTYKQVILDRYDTDVFGHMWWKEEDGEYDYSSWDYAIERANAILIDPEDGAYDLNNKLNNLNILTSSILSPDFCLLYSIQ